MEIVTRQLAKSLLEPRYFTGMACKYGHVAERRVDSGSCCECSRLWTKRWRENDKAPQDTYNPQGKSLPSVEYLLECFDYLDGKLVWKIRPITHFTSLRGFSVFNSKMAGKEAGHVHKSNHYTEVRLNNKLYKLHRLIFKIFNGRDPNNCIDHIDGDPSNNRIENLREATQQENSRNMTKSLKSSSVYKGVFPKRNKWLCSICINDRSYTHIFPTEIEAAEHYDRLAKEHFGEFANLNFKEE